MEPALRARGVVTASAGNHGQGVGLAAGRLGIAATVVVPEPCPAVKRNAIARYGVEMIVAGAGYDDAEAYALRLARERGVPFVSPYDDEDVIAGNGGWLGGEIAEQLPSVSRVLAPVGGGGLVAGLLQALPDATVIGVEPRVNCAMHESLVRGHALTEYRGAETICEGLEGATARRTFEIARARRLDIALVEEDEILGAVGFAYRALGQIIEPSAAVGIAAVRTRRVRADEKTVIVVSGGNIEPELLDRAIRFYDGSSINAAGS
jgi:threonine dehydratase